MRKTLIFLSLLIAIQATPAQYVELTADIETVVHERGTTPRPQTWKVRCVVGTNTWYMEGEFVKDTKTSWWFTGTNLIERTVLTKGIPGSPVGTESIRTYDSMDGDPRGLAYFEDLLRLPSARISWLAFCSGPCLKREDRRLLPPSDLWRKQVAAPEDFSDNTVPFEDSLGLPRTVNLLLRNKPVLDYKVLRSTNISGWKFPLEFSLVQSRSGAKWEPHFAAKGRVTTIGISSKPEIPTGRKDPPKTEGSETQTPKPVLKVDNAHYVSDHDNPHPERYRIGAASGIVLDATGYTFKPSLGVQGRPVESVEIIQHGTGTEGTAERRYRLAAPPGETRFELSSTTMQPRPGSPPFTGFHTGERWFAFILMNSANEPDKTFAAWSGVIEVN